MPEDCLARIEVALWGGFFLGYITAMLIWGIATSKGEAMKKSRKSQVAGRLVEEIRAGTTTVSREGMVTRNGIEQKRRLSKQVMARMAREGARLNEGGVFEAD